MKIRDIMVAEIEVAEADDTLDEIAIMMRDQDVGAIPIVEDDELIGIITDRDIVVRCVAEGKDPSEISADEVISSDLETIGPDADVEEARQMMANKQIRRLPVVEGGRLVGMLSLGDLAVKTEMEEETAETLENISEGVKATDQSAAQMGGKSAGGNEQEKPRRDRVEEQDRGRVDRKQQSGERKQGISNQAAGKEVARQERVVPIRTEQKSNVRGQKKTSKRKAS